MTSYRKHSVVDKIGLTCRRVLYQIWDKKLYRSCNNFRRINPL